MNRDYLKNLGTRTYAVDIEEVQKAFLSKVYAWMTGGLLVTGLTAWYTASSGFYMTIFDSGLFLPLIILQLGLVFGLSGFINKINSFLAGIAFMFYSLLTGLTLSVIFIAYTAESIQTVFFITAGMFAILSAYGYFTKRNLSAVGSFMFMGLIGIIIASVINMFISSSFLHFAISIIGVIVFSGLTAYDTQKLKDMAVGTFDSDESAAKGAILGALALYLDFVNLFIFLLRLLGSRR